LKNGARHLPPLNALRSFEAAARLGSFNQAAEELCVTPSAISHQIKTLERFLGLPLFVREQRRVNLTLAGERFLGAVEHALDEIDVATRRLLAKPNAGLINISATPAFLTRWLVPRIREFQTCHADVELRLSAATGQIDFHHSDTDMAIYFGRGDWQGITHHFLWGVTLVPVCSPRLLQGDKPLNGPRDLRHHTLLKVASRPDEWQRVLDQSGIARSMMQTSMSFSTSSLALGGALEGAGVALTDSRLVERELRYGQLIIPFQLTFETANGFYLAYQQGRQLTRGMRAFLDWIIAEVEAEVSAGASNGRSGAADSESD